MVEGLVTPSAGKVRVLGMDPRKDPRHAKASIGVQLQSTAFQPELVLTELVQLYAGLYGMRLSAPEARRRLDGAGLGEAAGKRAPVHAYKSVNQFSDIQGVSSGWAPDLATGAPRSTVVGGTRLSMYGLQGVGHPFQHCVPRASRDGWEPKSTSLLPKPFAVEKAHARPTRLLPALAS